MVVGAKRTSEFDSYITGALRIIKKSISPVEEDSAVGSVRRFKDRDDKCCKGEELKSNSSCL